MAVIVLDFETYFDKEYSLRKMTPVEYILDPRFEMIGCAIIDPKFGTPHTRIFAALEEFARYIEWVQWRQKDGEHITVLSHNALFDMCILHWRYGFLPDLMVDTMGMSRALVFAFTGSVSLDAVAQHLGLPNKGKMPNVQGMRAADIRRAGLWNDYTSYACHDAYLCYGIFQHLAHRFPRDEYEVMDMVLRCAVVPRFRLDTNLLAENKADLGRQKQELLQKCNVSVTDLMSNEKFADALRAIGIEPPIKKSPTTGLETYAFAKSDPAMVELAEHERPDVQALIAARVGHKSTLAETRADRLMKISMLPWPGKFNVGSMNSWGPIPLRYAGAHTHRLSGDWKLNPQNWAKYTFLADGSKETGKLRRAHMAPPGHKVVKRDSSQIEARIVAWLAGQTDLVEAFAQGKDIYSDFAQNYIYHYPVNKNTVDERFVGKQVILGLGFGMGPPKFKSHTAMQSFNALGHSIIIELPKCTEIVRAYRNRFPKIEQRWNALRDLIPLMASNENLSMPFGPCEVRHQKIILPNGLPLFYHDLKFDRESGEWWCVYGKKRKKLFGGKVYENIVQALSRILTMGAALRMQRTYPYLPRLAHQVHDDLVYVVPDEQVEEVDEALEFFMNDVPDWAQGLPLASEGGVGPNYGDCK
jgi:hypothetical protein